MPQDEVIQGLSVALSALDLGEVWEEPKHRVRLPIRNLTIERIHIKKFSTSCDCFEVAPLSLDLAPGEESVVEVTLDLTRRSPREVGLVQRSLGAEIGPVLDASTKRAEKFWQFRGTVKSALTLHGRAIEFEEFAESMRTAEPVALRMTAHPTVMSVEVKSEPPLVAVQVRRSEEDPGRIDLIVTPIVPRAKGRFRGVLEISARIEESTPCLTYKVPFAGEVVPDVRALPERLLFRPQTVGSFVEEVVVLQTSPGIGIVSTIPTTENADTTVEAVSVSGIDAGKAFRVRSRVRSEGEQRGRVCFRVKRSDGRIEVIEVPTVASGVKEDRR
jgi:hypothetical protein